MMRKFILAAAAAVVSAGLLIPAANAASGYPLKEPRKVDWSFAGPFGMYDKAQLQRGFQVFKEVCAACHSMNLIAFRNFKDLGYTDAQIDALAAEYEVASDPNEEGEVVMRPAKATDYWPSPFANDKEAAYLNNGALPPDFSKLAMARAVERGFPTFVFDIFTQYAESGPDYIYSLLTGYGEEPENPEEIPDLLSYNPYFNAGKALAMAQPLYDDLVEYTDGSPMTVDQYSKDVTAFMKWAAEPTLDQRKAMGFTVIIFLIIFAGLLYAAKRKVFSDVAH
jgi:ubiquinol-cytochrome c reductase cytochrome c1 subunit